MIYILMVIFTSLPANFDYTDIPDNTIVLQSGDVVGIPQGQVVFDNERACNAAAQQMIRNINANIHWGVNNPEIGVGCAKVDIQN